MRAEPKERLDPEARRLWRVEGAISTAFLFVFAWGARFILRRLFDGPEAPAWPLRLADLLPWIVLFGVGTLSVIVVPSVRWRRWRYEIRDAEVDLQRGALYVTRTLVPLARIQHVDTQQGPLERAFGLATVVFHTAAGANRIPALADNVAAGVRDRIAELTRVHDEL
jgi:membrane protein YdbS with pleckstrin-like domain